jgi:hypothetical protein
MKRLLLLLLLLFCLPVQAQEPNFTYLPIIMGTTVNLECMSNGWRFVNPVATTNQVVNPSGETTGNFVALGAATVTQVTTFQKYGIQSYRLQTGGNAQGIQLALGNTLTNQTYWATARVRGKLPARWGFILKASPLIQAQLLETYGDGWFLYGVRFDGSRANGSTFVRIAQIGPGSGDFYVDGVQVEAQTEYTTYCDGTQPGCGWNGVANASTSTRSGQSRAGGKPQDLFDDYGFLVQKVVGTGAVTPTIGLDPYALLPGAELNSIKLEPRNFTLVGKFIADSEQELHDNRQALITALASDTYPDNQPVKFQFYGARVPKEISAYYQGGLEGDLAAFYNKTFSPVEDSQWEETKKFVEKAAIQLVAPDPMWYEIGESAAVLDTNDSDTFRVFAGRLKSTGQWSALGPPNAAGTYGNAQALAEDATYIYIGGSFSNFDNIAAADNIVRYNKQTGVYSALGSGLNNIVNAIAIAPNGDVYIAGQFTDAGGIAAADYLTVWNGTAFAAVGVPLTGAAAITSARALAFDLSGNLYIGGSFLNWNNIANADGIVMWNGTAYSALSTGTNFTVNALAIGFGNILYVGGTFTTIGGTAANYVASWDGSTFSALGTGLNALVNRLVVDPNSGLVYMGGDFTTAGGNTANYTASWNGASFAALGSGLSGSVISLSIGQDGTLYVGGGFASAGGITLAEGIARWNGYAWAHLDIDLPGVPNVYGVLASKFVDPVIEQKYDLFLSFDTSGTGNFAGKITASNGGSALAFPKIVYTRSGGTTAIIETLKNETIGLEILFNYSLLNGETLTVDLNPLNRTVISSFFGPRFDAVLPNSDFGIWALQPGSQDLTSFVATSGAPTVTAYILFRDSFKSWD